MQKEEEQFCIPANVIVKIRKEANSDFRNGYVGVPVMHTGRRMGQKLDCNKVALIFLLIFINAYNLTGQSFFSIKPTHTQK